MKIKEIVHIFLNFILFIQHFSKIQKGAHFALTKYAPSHKEKCDDTRVEGLKAVF